MSFRGLGCRVYVLLFKRFSGLSGCGIWEGGFWQTGSAWERGGNGIQFRCLGLKAVSDVYISSHFYKASQSLTSLLGRSWDLATI